MAMNVPQAAPWLARMDDWVGHGRINPVKKWWWDLEEQDDGSYSTDVSVNQREIQTDLDLKYEDQTLAVYPAPLISNPTLALHHGSAIEAYQAMVTAEAYKLHLPKAPSTGRSRSTLHPDAGDGVGLRPRKWRRGWCSMN